MKVERVSRLALGTVQFGMPYGISNQSGQVHAEEVCLILQEAWRRGVRILDTSSGYGESECVLGECDVASWGFGIISKYPSDGGDVVSCCKTSLQKLGVSKFYGYLLHHFRSYQEDKTVWYTMCSLQQKGLVERIGFSLYHPQELEEILHDGVSFDIVQVPYNLFDRRFERYFPRLHELGVEIYTRSVFLQGLFFCNLNDLGSSFDELKPALNQLQQYANTMGKTVASLALSFVWNNPYVHRVVVGINSLDEFQEHFHTLKQVQDVKGLHFDVQQDCKLLLPYNWK